MRLQTLQCSKLVLCNVLTAMQAARALHCSEPAQCMLTYRHIQQQATCSYLHFACCSVSLRAAGCQGGALLTAATCSYLHVTCCSVSLQAARALHC
jgi:hypothetical protein